METLTIIGEILGYAAIVFTLLIFISISRSRIFKFKMATDFCFCLNQILLGMMTGAALYGISLARSCIFYQRGKRKWADNPLWVVLFIVLTLISPILTWAGPVSLLPAIGSVFCVFSYYAKSTILLRILSFIGESLWLIYGIVSGSTAVTIAGVISLISIVIGMFNEWHHRRKHQAHPSLEKMD